MVPNSVSLGSIEFILLASSIGLNGIQSFQHTDICSKYFGFYWKSQDENIVWINGEKVPRELKKSLGTRRGFSSIFVRAQKDSSRCCQPKVLPLSPPLLF